MSRRPARCTEADISRALKAAERLGPHWAVEILRDGTIRLAHNAIAIAADPPRKDIRL